MNTQPEALRLADAIDGAYWEWKDVPKMATELRRLHEENQALRQAPSTPEQEPVAWMYDRAKYRENDLRGRQWAFKCFSQTKPYMDEMVRNVTPLYTTPPATPAQEPVAWRKVLPGGRKTDEWESARVGDYNRGWNDYRKAAKAALENLYTTPPAQPAPVQEPVAWIRKNGFRFDANLEPQDDSEIPLYTAPPKQPEQRPVGTYEGVMEAMLSLHNGTLEQQQVYGHMKDKLLYTAPPHHVNDVKKREWVGLTEQDVHDAFKFTELVKQLSFSRERPEWCENFAAYIEAKLKEKNT